MNIQTKSQFVAVASITSELSAVMVVAKEISLAAANAKAIAFRAGDKAKGFQPITDFINELAKETIDLVTNINVYALSLYRLTVNEYRRTVAYNKFDLVVKTTEGVTYAQSMQAPLENAKISMQNCQRQFKRDVKQLLDQLEAVMHHARAARVIAANSRIEASQAGEYLQSLQAVAESVDKAAHTIHDNVQRCRIALSLYRNS
ncbi:MAG: chemotaxis protein [Methylovulum sp.]|jgi:methyl-accepting chemotaxis protein|nr:chemotaxis protein [Methylovulum sp.]MCF7999214.1 chemotaxis protein [Methylovulum sp.]